MCIVVKSSYFYGQGLVNTAKFKESGRKNGHLATLVPTPYTSPAPPNHHAPPHHHPAPTHTHTNSKLHDRAEIEQNSENKSYLSILGDPKTVFEPYPTPKIAR